MAKNVTEKSPTDDADNSTHEPPTLAQNNLWSIINATEGWYLDSWTNFLTEKRRTNSMSGANYSAPAGLGVLGMEEYPDSEDGSLYPDTGTVSSIFIVILATSLSLVVLSVLIVTFIKHKAFFLPRSKG